MHIRTHLLIVAYAFAATACGTSSSGFPPNSGTPSPDGGGTQSDGATNPGFDASQPPTGDSSTPGADSASSSDAQEQPDIGVVEGGTYDFGCGGSSACPLSTVCCATPGAAQAFACVAPASCPAGDQITCDGPDECSGASPICCGVAVANGTGTFPTCNLSAIGTTCSSAANCVTHIGSCSETSKVQICHTSADCTAEPANNKCCTFTNGGAKTNFCIDSASAALAGGVCH